MRKSQKVTAAIVSTRKADINGVSKVLITVAGGDVHYFPETYVDKLLASNELEGAMYGTLVGCIVSYIKYPYKKGDAVFNVRKGVEDEIAGKTYQNDGFNADYFQVEVLGDKAEAFQALYSKEVQKHKAKSKLSAMDKFLAKAQALTTATEAPKADAQVGEEESVDSTEDAI